MALPPTVMKSVNWAAHRLLAVSGYRFELRRSGELKLGLWRKPLHRGRRPRNPRRLVVIPGFGDTPLSWLGVISLLQPLVQKRFDEIVLFDFPGFQGSLFAEKGFHSMDLLMEKVADTLDSLKPQALLGHSLGGWLSAHYAGLCGAGRRPIPGPSGKKQYTGPELLILADPSGAFKDETIKTAFIDRFQRMMKNGFSEIRPHIFGKEPFWFRFLISEFTRFASSEDIRAFMSSVGEQHLVEPLLPGIQSRVWLLWGEKDTLVPAECAEGWLSSFGSQAQARALILKGIGHSPQIENPALTAAVLSQMLLDRKGEEKAHLRLGHRLAARWWRVIEVAAPVSTAPASTVTPLSTV